MYYLNKEWGRKCTAKCSASLTVTWGSKDPIFLRKCVPKNYSIDNNKILTTRLRGTPIPASRAEMLVIYNL